MFSARFIADAFLDHIWYSRYRVFSCDVTAAMLVYPTTVILPALSSIIMQTFSFVSVEKQGY